MFDVIEGFRFLRTEMLWLIVPGLIAFVGLRLLVKRTLPESDGHTARVETERSPWAQVIDPALLPYLLHPVKPSALVSERGPLAAAGDRFAIFHGRCRWIRHGLAFMVLVLALAGPQLRTGEGLSGPKLQRPDEARVLLVDLSPAFDALPIPTREHVRQGLRQFLGVLLPGETSLVVYSGAAWRVVPLTEDVRVLDGFLSDLSSAAVPVQGYRHDEGLALASRVLAEGGAYRQYIYWLQADAPQLEHSAQALGPGQQLSVLRAEAPFAEWLRIAQYATPAGASIDSRLNLTPGDAPGWLDLGPGLIALAVLLLAVDVWRPLAARTVLAGLFCLGAGLVSEHAWAEPNFESGVALYRAGQFDAAADSFSRASPPGPKAHYNRGNALARAGRLQEALAAYDAALLMRPDDDDTQFNRDLVARLLQSPPDKPPRGSSGGSPPPAHSAASSEADRAAAQWLRRSPVDTRGLLKQKLTLEEARRRSAEK